MAKCVVQEIHETFVLVLTFGAEPGSGSFELTPLDVCDLLFWDRDGELVKLDAGDDDTGGPGGRLVCR